MLDQHWTEKRINQVRELASQRYSSGEIALKLDTTRNSIIGLCRRQNIPLQSRKLFEPQNVPAANVVASGPKKSQDAAQPLGASGNTLFVQHGNAPSPSGKTIFRPKKFKYEPSKNISHGIIGDSLWAGQGISVMEATPLHCRWPKGVRDGKQMCCGEFAFGSSSYCPEHQAISTSGKPPAVSYVNWNLKR